MGMDSVLDALLEKTKSAPVQRSCEWLKYRNTRIGGSEMHNICKLNKKNINTFINTFLCNKIDRKNCFIPPCEFGNLFENEIRKYTEQKYGTVIHEYNVFQYDGSPYICYSCDGIGVVNDVVTLFEFKCPYTRVPSKEIKYEYICQINTGLNVIRECKQCYYCEGEFKKCQITDLYNYSGFDATCHNSSPNRDFNALYASYGIMYVYTLDEDCANEYDVLVDFGRVHKFKFVSCLNQIYEKNYKIAYVSDLINEGLIDTNRPDMPYNNNRVLPNESMIGELHKGFLTYINNIGAYAIGYIPWKLYNYDTIIPERDVNFFDNKTMDKINYVGNLLDVVQNIPDIEDKKRLFTDATDSLLLLCQ